MTNDKYLNDETPLVVLKMFGKFLAKEKPELLEALRSCLGKTAFTPVNKEDRPKLKEAFQEFLPYQRKLLEEDNAILSETLKKYFFDEEKPAEPVEEETSAEPKFEMNFGNDLVKMGFKLGSFNDSKYEYNNKNILNITDYNQLKKMLKHTDYNTATSLLISKWRYITHWSYMDYQQEKDLPFFKAVIERIFELSE